MNRPLDGRAGENGVSHEFGRCSAQRLEGLARMRCPETPDSADQAVLRVVGSSTSRSQSPTTLMDRVVRKIANPGIPAIHHAFRR